MPSKYSKGTMLLSHIGILITVIAWGSSFVATKVLMVDGGFSPVEVYVYRFIMAYLIILAFTFKKILSNNWRDEFLFFLCGICAGSLYFITENYALSNTTTGNVSLLVGISPIFTTLLISLFYRTPLKPGVLIGSAIAFAGVACVIFSNGDSLEFHPLGDFLALAAALSFALYTVIIRRLIPHYNSFFITRKLFLYGVLTAAPLLLIQKEPLHLNMLFNLATPQYILNMLFLVLFCSVLAYIVWNEAMKYLGEVMANNYLYLQPLVTMVLGYFIFDEHIYLMGYLGCVLIIGGLVASDKLNIEFRKNKLKG